MSHQTDQQLLRDYAARRSEPAFAELVRRHVDLVYSAALRMVRDPHLAQDVTQAVFVALAQNAAQLTNRSVLSGWLHRTAQNLAANAVRSTVRRRAREQEAAAMNELLAHQSDASWEHIAPHLDAALGELGESDRDALLLRYFERKSAREMALTLGVSEDAAQKRVTRAVERLREFFAKRGVTIGAGGLVVIISADAVQAAPAGLAVAITAALAGTAITTAAVTTKAIAMTALQKTLITASLAAAVSVGIFEAHQASSLRTEVRTLQQQQAPLAGQIEQLQQERGDITNRLALLAGENAALKGNSAELLKLRGEVTQLRSGSKEPISASVPSKPINSPADSAAQSLSNRVRLLKQRLEQMPELKIPELQFLTDRDWLSAAGTNELQTDDDFRDALMELRASAKVSFGAMIRTALIDFARANDGLLPATMSELQPYFKIPIGEPLLDRYELTQTGAFDLKKQATWVVEKAAPVDNKFDTRLEVRSGVVIPVVIPDDSTGN